MIKKYKPTSPGRRGQTIVVTKVRKVKPSKRSVKGLMKAVKGSNARSKGRISVQCRGGTAKRRYRKVDFKRDKYDVVGKVESIEYDPNRTCNIALILYPDGERRYILSPNRLKEGDEIVSSEKADINVGNTLPLGEIPVGVAIHNIELYPNAGGRFIRSAGSVAFITAHEGKYVDIKMPSGEIRKFLAKCLATIGQVGNEEWKLINFGKAGRMKHLGKRPKTRGKARSGGHPLGGSYSRRVGRQPVDQWGNKSKGKKTRHRKHTNKYIVKDRRRK